jgi:CAAX prenyl protease-like protein
MLWYFRSSYTEVRLTWSWTAFGTGIFVFGLWLAFEPLYTGSQSGQDIGDDLARMPLIGSAVWLVLRVVGSVIVAPLVEELAFRGYFLRRLINADFREVAVGRLTWLSVGLSSVAFGVVHGRWIAATLAGLCYALVLRRRAELSDAILAHATTNALIVVYVLATGAWNLWN